MVVWNMDFLVLLVGLTGLGAVAWMSEWRRRLAEARERRSRRLEPDVCRLTFSAAPLLAQGRARTGGRRPRVVLRSAGGNARCARPSAACGGGAEADRKSSPSSPSAPRSALAGARANPIPPCSKSLLEKALSGIDVTIATAPPRARPPPPPPSASAPKSPWRGPTC